jgi:hypothetical protein
MARYKENKGRIFSTFHIRNDFLYRLALLVVPCRADGRCGISGMYSGLRIFFVHNSHVILPFGAT